MITLERASPLLKELPAPRRRIDVQGMPLAWSYADLAQEADSAADLALCDLSGLPRAVCKGPTSQRHLASLGLFPSDEVYSVCPVEGGGILVRTGASEFFLEDGPTGGTARRVLQAAPPDCLAFSRQDASLALCGRRAELVLRQTCSFDFAMAPRTFIMTRIAGVSVGALSRQGGRFTYLQLWCDPSYGAYLAHTLQTIVAELGGAVVGLQAIFPTLAV